MEGQSALFSKRKNCAFRVFVIVSFPTGALGPLAVAAKLLANRQNVAEDHESEIGLSYSIESRMGNNARLLKRRRPAQSLVYLVRLSKG
jgi:hypothetical protein